MPLKLAEFTHISKQLYHRQETGCFHLNIKCIPSNGVRKRRMIKQCICRCFPEQEEKKLTCLVYFNSRAICYFVQKPYEAGFKICGKKRKHNRLMLSHPFQAALPIQVLPWRVGYLGFSQDLRGFTGGEPKQLKSTDQQIYG